MTISDKLESLLTGEDGPTCFVSRENGTVIDTVFDGLTRINGNTLAEIRERYPDAEEMTLDAWCNWKSALQRTPISWDTTTEERYSDMLGCLPPAYYASDGFLVGEPYDHDALTGEPRYQAFRKVAGAFVVASRPMTVREFRSL